MNYLPLIFPAILSFSACVAQRQSVAETEIESKKTSQVVPGLGEETLEEDEAESIQKLIELVEFQASQIYKVMTPAQKEHISRSKTGDTVRAVHTKSHGCVKGGFFVNENLPADYQTGVFQSGLKFPAWIRLSNGAPGYGPDKDPTSRGFAIKLLNVEKILGERLQRDQLRWSLPRYQGQGQDFLFLNAPAFPVKTLKTYITFTENLEKGGMAPLTTFARPDLRAAASEARAFLGMITQNVESPLEISYFSQLPYQFKDRAAKYRIDSCAKNSKLKKNRRQQRNEKKGDDYLYERTRNTLEDNGETACFDFSVIRQMDPVVQPIEDSNIEWLSDDKSIEAAQRYASGKRKNIDPKKKFANRLTVARILIPQQTVTAPLSDSTCEGLSFNSWNALEEHKPLGNMNRARKAVYDHNANLRKRRESPIVADEEHHQILQRLATSDQN